MKKQDIDRVLTTSVIQDRVNRQLVEAFRRVRDDWVIRSDEELARELGFTTSYTHWLAGRRDWPIAEACKLAEKAGCHLDELLRMANMEARR